MKLSLPTRALGWAPRAWQLALLAAALLLALVLPRVLARPYVFHGSLIEPPVPAADFTLTDQSGRSFRLGDQAGKAVLLYFGYTACADVCPATLAEFKLVRQRLGAQAERVQFVFITVDPQRDTAAQLGAYLAQFDSSFIGLTGATGELKPIWRGYGVYQNPRADIQPSGATVDHTDRVYAIDPRGRLRLTYSLDIGADALAADVRTLLGEP